MASENANFWIPRASFAYETVNFAIETLRNNELEMAEEILLDEDNGFADQLR